MILPPQTIGDAVLSISDAILSTCGTYRYRLTRQWASAPAPVCFIMLNPSTADATRDDPTIRRCIGFAQRMGASGLEVVNLFALRSTDPRALKAHTDPIGPHNDDYILMAAKNCGTVICAWGQHGALRNRDAGVVKMLRSHGITPLALKISKSGKPSHPLYLSYDLQPQMLP